MPLLSFFWGGSPKNDDNTKSTEVVLALLRNSVAWGVVCRLFSLALVAGFLWMGFSWTCHPFVVPSASQECPAPHLLRAVLACPRQPRFARWSSKRRNSSDTAPGKVPESLVT